MATSTSSVVSLDAGEHTIFALCKGEDITSRHINLDYVVVRNSQAVPTPGLTTARVNPLWTAVIILVVALSFGGIGFVVIRSRWRNSPVTPQMED